MDCDDETKSKIIKSLSSLHKIVVTQDQDNRIA
jgi:hypothetical protein